MEIFGCRASSKDPSDHSCPVRRDSKMLVAGAPEVPSVATHDFLGREIDAGIHWFENVGGDLRKIGGTFAGRFGFIDRLIFRAADESHARKKPASDSRETENVVSAFSQRLHRAAVDTSVGSALAREFKTKSRQASPAYSAAKAAKPSRAVDQGTTASVPRVSGR